MVLLKDKLLKFLNILNHACENVFAGILTFSTFGGKKRLILISNKLEKVKIPAKTFSELIILIKKDKSIF